MLDTLTSMQLNTQHYDDMQYFKKSSGGVNVITLNALPQDIT